MTNDPDHVLDHLRAIQQDLRSLERLLRCVQIEVATDACREIERTSAIDARLANIEASMTRSINDA